MILYFPSEIYFLKKTTTKISLLWRQIYPVTLDNQEEKNSAKLPPLPLKKHSVERAMLLIYDYKCKYHKSINKRAYLSKYYPC